MKFLALIAIALVSMVIAQDCSGKTLKSDTTLKIGGRNAIVQFPNGFGSKPAPLLINYHPIMGSAQQWKGGSQIAKVALADGAVVAFLDGATGGMGQAWNVGPCCTDADDVLNSLVISLKKLLPKLALMKNVYMLLVSQWEEVCQTMLVVSLLILLPLLLHLLLI